GVDLVGCRQRLDCSLGKTRPPRLRQIAEVETPDAVAARTNLRVDLEAALQLRIIKMAEHPPEAPVLAVDLRVRLLCRARRPSERRDERAEQDADACQAWPQGEPSGHVAPQPSASLGRSAPRQ